MNKKEREKINMEVKGYIHSFESFGTKDGPGIRFVLFLQGCPLRCLYCHNVDTWEIKDKKMVMTAQEVMKEILKVRGFIKTGGVTVSGGEPLMQPEFLMDCLNFVVKMEFRQHLIHLDIFSLTRQSKCLSLLIWCCLILST